MITTLGPLDPLPEFKLVDLLKWAVAEAAHPELTVAYGNDIREKYACAICNSVDEDFFKIEALAAHAKKSERCQRAQQRVWAVIHGWKLIGRSIAHAQGTPTAGDLSLPPAERSLIGKWLGACQQENIPCAKLELIHDSAAPAWIVEAILIYETTSALKEMPRPRYLRAVARDVRKALGRIAS